MKTGRVQRSLLSWSTGLLGTLAMAGAGFVATPWLVRWLGDARFGAWETIGEWLAYIGLTQMALGPAALGVLLLRAHTHDSHAAFVGLARWGLRLYTRGCLGAMPLALGFAWMAPLWTHAPPGQYAPLRWTLAVCAVGSLALAPGFAVFRSVLETRQRAYWMRLAMAVQGVTITGLSLACAHAGWGLPGMAAASVAGTAVGALLLALSVRGDLRGWRHTPPARVRARAAWRLNWPILAATLGNQINLFTDNTVVLLLLGPAAVPAFFLTERLVQFVGSQVNDVGGVSWAGLGELRAGDPRRFGERTIELAATIAGVGLVLVSAMAAYNRAFVQLWVSPRYFAGNPLTWLAGAGAVVFGYVCFFGSLLDSQGDTRRRLWVSTIGSGLNLALSILLARRWGVAGVAAGTLIAYCATDAWYLPYLTIRHYGVPGGALLRASLNALARAGAFALAAAWLGSRLPTAAHWWVLLAQLGLTGAAGLGYCWFLILRPTDRALWRARWQGTSALLSAAGG